MRTLHVASLLAFVAVATSSLLEAAPIPVWVTRDRARANWTARLEGRDGRKVRGTASARPSADGKGTDVTVSLEGDTPGATRPWHVHSGRCGQSGGVVGGGRAYTPMSIDAKGNGQASATVPVPLADTSHYYVNIHDAATAMGIIVACGDLLP